MKLIRTNTKNVNLPIALLEDNNLSTNKTIPNNEMYSSKITYLLTTNHNRSLPYIQGIVDKINGLETH